jgi:hypothetical protein
MVGGTAGPGTCGGAGIVRLSRKGSYFNTNLAFRLNSVLRLNETEFSGDVPWGDDRAMVKPLENPYRPGAGPPQPYLAGHATDLDEMTRLQEVVAASKHYLPKPLISSHISQMLSTLSEAGLVYKSRHGKHSSGVPLLAAFIERQSLLTGAPTVYGALSLRQPYHETCPQNPTTLIAPVFRADTPL